MQSDSRIAPCALLERDELADALYCARRRLRVNDDARTEGPALVKEQRKSRLHADLLSAMRRHEGGNTASRQCVCQARATACCLAAFNCGSSKPNRGADARQSDRGDARAQTRTEPPTRRGQLVTPASQAGAVHAVLDAGLGAMSLRQRSPLLRARPVQWEKASSAGQLCGRVVQPADLHLVRLANPSCPHWWSPLD